VFYVVGNTRNAPCDPDTGLLKLRCQEDERRSGGAGAVRRLTR
jgi:hypothetical protein